MVTGGNEAGIRGKKENKYMEIKKGDRYIYMAAEEEKQDLLFMLVQTNPSAKTHLIAEPVQ